MHIWTLSTLEAAVVEVLLQIWDQPTLGSDFLASQIYIGRACNNNQDSF